MTDAHDGVIATEIFESDWTSLKLLIVDQDECMKVADNNSDIRRECYCIGTNNW